MLHDSPFYAAICHSVDSQSVLEESLGSAPWKKSSKSQFPQDGWLDDPKTEVARSPEI